MGHAFVNDDFTGVGVGGIVEYLCGCTLQIQSAAQVEQGAQTLVLKCQFFDLGSAFRLRGKAQLHGVLFSLRHFQ